MEARREEEDKTKTTQKDKNKIQNTKKQTTTTTTEAKQTGSHNLGDIEVVRGLFGNESKWVQDL